MNADTALAAHRVTRLIVADKLTEPARGWWSLAYVNESVGAFLNVDLIVGDWSYRAGARGRGPYRSADPLPTAVDAARAALAAIGQEAKP